MENLGPTLRSLVSESAAHGLSSLRDLFDVQEVDTPFVGLRPFEIPDSPLFFGRREQTDELLQRLHRTRFVAVVGGSGCGKSSLVRAGLIPALQAGFLVADRDTWANFTMKPGDQPLRNLAAALPREDGEPVSLEETAAGIRTFGVNAVLDRLQPLILKGSNVLLVVDQFEETFRFGLEGDEDRRDEAADFISILLALVQKPELPIYIVLTMRSDFMGDCDVFPGLAETMNRSLYLVPRLTRQQRREAIEGPIRMAGAAISPRLLDLLLNESDMASDQLPVLQHALMRAWEEWREDENALAAQPSNGNGGPSPAGILGRPLRQPEISIDHYKRAGTLENALNRHAEEALEGLDLDLTRKIFQALTDVDVANRQIRRPARLSVLGKVTGGTEESVTEVLRRFQSDGRCFVVWASPEGHPDPLIDLSHESLIRCWKRLGKWVEEESESAAVYRRLETATVWRQRGGDLWRDTNLQQALDWRAAHHVGPDWAARVRASEVFRKPSWKRPTFQQVLEFLEKSRAARDEVRQREEAQARKLLLAQEREAQARKQAANDQMWLRRMKAISAVAAVLTIVAGGLAVYLTEIKSKLEDVVLSLTATKSELEDVVLSTRLTQQSKALATANPQLGALLALEAVHLAPPDVRSTREPENALRSALASIGGRGLGGHSGVEVSSMAVSPDGHWLISGGLDGSARRWNLFNPRPEQTSEVIFGAAGEEGAEHQAAVFVATAPGKIATGGARGTVRLEGQDRPLKTDGPNISALALDASGHWLVAGDEKGDVWLWNLTARNVREVPLEKHHEAPVVIAKLSDDGRWLVTASATEAGELENRGETKELMVLWRLSVDQAPLAVKVEKGVSTVDLRDDRLAVGFRNGTIKIWHIGDAGAEKITEAHLVSRRGSEPVPASIRAIALEPGGKFIAAAEDGLLYLEDGIGQIAVLSMEEKQEQKELQVVKHLAISPGGSWLVAAYNGGSVRLRFIGRQTKSDVLELRGHSGSVETIAFSPLRPGSLDSRWLFTGGSDGTVRRWDLGSADPSNEAVLHRGRWFTPWVIGLSPDRNWLIAGDEKETELSYLRGNIHESLPGLTSAKISDDSRWLLIGRGNEPAERSFELRRLIPGHGSDLVQELRDASAAAIAPHPVDPNDPWLVTGQKADGSIWIRKARSKGFEDKAHLILQGGREPVNQIVLTPDRRYVLVARAQGDQGMVEVWRLRDLKMVFEKRIGNPQVAMSPDSRWLAMADAANVTLVLDLKSAKPMPYEVKNNLDITTMMLSSVPAKASRLILGFEDGTAKSYLLRDKAPDEERVLDGHRGAIFSLTASRDGRFVATGGGDGARVWDLKDHRSSPSVISTGSTEKGASTGSLFGSWVMGLAFSDGDETLLTVALDGTVRRWGLTEAMLQEEAERAVGRNMSESEWCKYFSDWFRGSSRSYQATFEDLPSPQHDRACPPINSYESN